MFCWWVGVVGASSRSRSRSLAPLTLPLFGKEREERSEKEERMEARTHSTRAAKFPQCQCLLNVCECVSQKNCDEGEMKMYVLNNANVFRLWSRCW
jgi:hypothetical protein